MIFVDFILSKYMEIAALVESVKALWLGSWLICYDVMSKQPARET